MGCSTSCVPVSAPRAIESAQRLLDRTIFIAFAEDRGLLPKRNLPTAYSSITQRILSQQNAYSVTAAIGFLSDPFPKLDCTCDSPVTLWHFLLRSCKHPQLSQVRGVKSEAKGQAPWGSPGSKRGLVCARRAPFRGQVSPCP